MLRIFLVRHGQNQDNAQGILNGHRDEPLTEIGLAQAHEIAQKLQTTSIVFDKVYSSPLTRALKTAEIITEVLGISNPEIMREIIERDFGIMTGQPQAEIERMCAPNIIKTDTITYFLDPAGAETFPQLLERAKKVLTNIKRAHNDGNILLVTHGDFGKMLYTAYYDLDWRQVLEMFHFGNSDVLELSASSPASDPHLHKINQHNL